MIETPLVSVVIPAYNRIDTLERAVDSVWVQDIDDLEIVIVDDGSTDGTADLIGKLHRKDGRIRPVFHEKNKGEAGARNTGVRAARGKYIAFLDSDDEWLEGKLKTQIALMEGADDRVGACCTGQYQVDDTRRQRLLSDWTDDLAISDRNLLVYGCGVGMGTTFLIRSAVFVEVGYYDESLPLLVDLDWLCRLTRKYKVLKITTPYIKYYKSVLRRGEQMENGVRKFKEKNNRYLKTLRPLDRLKTDAKFYSYMATSYNEYGPWRDFIRTSARSFFGGSGTPIKHYLYFMAVLFGVRTIGKGRQP